MQFAGDQALRELPSPGKSGSVFFLSHDDKYIIKTVRKVTTNPCCAQAFGCACAAILALHAS